MFINFFFCSTSFEKIIARISDSQNGIAKIKDRPHSFSEEEKQPYLSPINRPQNGSPENSISKSPTPQVSFQKKPGVAAIFPEKQSFKANLKMFALVIEGDVVSHVFSSPKYTQDFLKVIPECRL